MPISTASAKAKGRNLQKWARDKLLAQFKALEPDDIKSTGMGQGGEDLQLSPAARKLIPITVECKARKSLALYSFMSQAETNAPKNVEPVVIVKADRKKPLAIIDAEYFIKLLSRKKK